MLDDRTIFDIIDAGDLEELQAMLNKKGAAVLLEEQNGQTPLAYAMLQLIPLTARENLNREILCNMVLALTNAAVKFGNFEQVTAQMQEGLTLLHLAVLTDDRQIIEALLDAGIAIDSQTYVVGLTSLMVAVQAGKRQAVRTLLRRGANPWMVTSDKLTAFDLAWKYHAKVIYCDLILHVVGIDDENIANMLSENNPEAINLLIKASCNALAADIPVLLTAALRLKLRDLARILILRWLSDTGNHPLSEFGPLIAYHAAGNGWIDLIHLLLNRGLTIEDISKSEQKDLLIAAIENSHEESVYELLNLGLRPRCPFHPRFGPSCLALETACRKRATNIIKIFIPMLPEKHRENIVFKAITYTREIIFKCDAMEVIEVIFQEVNLPQEYKINIAKMALQYGAVKCYSVISPTLPNLNTLIALDETPILSLALCPDGDIAFRRGHMTCVLNLISIGLGTLENQRERCSFVLHRCHESSRYRGSYILCRLGASPQIVIKEFCAGYKKIFNIIEDLQSKGGEITKAEIRVIATFISTTAKWLKFSLIGCHDYLSFLQKCGWSSLIARAVTELDEKILIPALDLLLALPALNLPDGELKFQVNCVLDEIYQCANWIHNFLKNFKPQEPRSLQEITLCWHLTQNSGIHWFEEMDVKARNVLVGPSWNHESLELLHRFLHAQNTTMMQMMAQHWLAFGWPEEMNELFNSDDSEGDSGNGSDDNSNNDGDND